MARQALAAVVVSVTSLDPRIAMTLEPRAPAPEQRLTAVRRLADAGVPVYVSIAPVVPAITDHEIEHIIPRAAEAGAGRKSAVEGKRVSVREDPGGRRLIKKKKNKTKPQQRNKN